MGNAVLHSMLVEWTEKEMSVENVQIYDLIQSYKRARNNLNRRVEIAAYIREAFLESHSLFSLNVREETVYRCLEDMEMQLYDDLLFVGIEMEVEHTLNDSLGRFCAGEEYLEYVNSEAKQKMFFQAALAQKRKSMSPMITPFPELSIM
jgi:hypothetical protein